MLPCHDQMRDKKEDMARLETMDCGKPLDEAEWDLVSH